MEPGTIVKTYDGKEGIIERRCVGHTPNEYENCYVLKMKGVKLQEKHKRVFPVKYTDFIRYQLRILYELDHFSKNIGLIRNHASLKISTGKEYDLQTISAIENYDDECIIFDSYLTLFRKNENIPYAFLQEVFYNVDDDNNNDIITLSTEGRQKLDYDTSCAYIKVMFNGRMRMFKNEKKLYVLDMGIMYMILQTTRFQTALLKNGMELMEFSHGMEYSYDYKHCVLMFKKNDSTGFIIGFDLPYYEFFIKRKMTFTQRRWIVLRNIYDCTHMLAAASVVKEKRIVLYPWSPMQFVHLQFLYSFHLLEYLTVVRKVDFDSDVQWNMYKQMCGTLYVSMENNSDSNIYNWNAKTPLELCRQFNPSNSYVLSSTFMDFVYDNELQKEAWISNFQHLLYLYADIRNIEVVEEKFLREESVVIINGNFLGSFHIIPVEMQAILYEEEKKDIMHHASWSYTHCELSECVYFPDAAEFSLCLT